MRSPRSGTACCSAVSWVVRAGEPLAVAGGPQTGASNGGLKSASGPGVALDPAQLSPGGPRGALSARSWSGARSFQRWRGCLAGRLGRLAPGQHDAWARTGPRLVLRRSCSGGTGPSGAPPRLAEQCLAVLITAGSCDSARLRLREALLVPLSLPGGGGLNGLFAKLLDPWSARRAGHLQRGSCSTYACFKGGPPMGRPATAGSARWHPPGSPQRTNRKLRALACTCAQACPHRSVQTELRPPRRRSAARDGATGRGSRLILVLAGGRLPESSWSGCWGLGAGSQLSLQLGPFSAAGLFCLGLARRRLYVSWRCGAGLLLPSSFYASRLRAGALWLVAPCSGPLSGGAHLPLGMAESGMVFAGGLAGVWLILSLSGAPIPT